jgi:integrase
MTPRISFYLKNPNAINYSVIFVRIRYEGFQIKYYLDLKVHPKLWDEKRQIVKVEDLKKFDETLIARKKINEKLVNVGETIINYIDTYQKENYNNSPPPELIKSHLNEVLTNRNKDLATDFLSFFKKFIDNSENGVRSNAKGGVISLATVTTYKTIYNRLLNFKEGYSFHIDFETIDKRFYDDFKKYLIREKFANNTIGKYFKVLKTVLRDAQSEGFKVNPFVNSGKFEVIQEDTDSIYLSKKEIDTIKNLDLSKLPRLDLTRDLFVVGCMTGLRFSDYSNLKKENFTDDGYIEIKQKKGKNNVVIPIRAELIEILEKYQYDLPTKITNQEFNRHIKEIGQMIPDLHQNVKTRRTEGGQEKETVSKKYELLVSHTCRRSFCTNEYRSRQLTTIQIMAISGHKTEKSFLKYIKLGNSDHAKDIKDKWENQ